MSVLLFARSRIVAPGRVSAPPPRRVIRPRHPDRLMRALGTRRDHQRFHVLDLAVPDIQEKPDHTSEHGAGVPPPGGAGAEPYEGGAMSRERWMALLFAAGSACFLVGPFPGYASLV